MKYPAALLAIVLAGCSAIERRSALDSEELLAQAGFRSEPLTGTALPDRQLVESAGTYKFADARFCECVYVGGPNEYAALQRLRADRIAERNWIMSRGPASAAARDRTAWSAWKPEGLDVVPAPVARR